MDESHPLLQQQRLLTSAVALTALGTQFVTILMANLSQEEKASWNEPETVALVNYFWEHRAEGGDGGTFKDTAFNAVAAHIAHLWTSGPAKTARKCKTKYNGVSLCHPPADRD